jgi:phage terminase small subunit
MAKKQVKAANMGVGKKKTGKHWTQAQLDARIEAERGLYRDKVLLIKPKWLTGRAAALWKWHIKQSKDLKILDNLDTTSLAIYCDLSAKYELLSPLAKELTDVTKLVSIQKALVSHADKLGFTPHARARLAQKAAKKILDPLDEFD